ncbi:MAG: hypothetical protein IBJ12_04845 [Sphingomonadaceae bacterium]|nr:hypothetical protein [Sphingomonadaceae bacterium]
MHVNGGTAGYNVPVVFAIAVFLLGIGGVYGPALLAAAPVPTEIARVLVSAEVGGGLLSWVMHLAGGALVWIPRRAMVAAAVASGGVWPGLLATWIVGIAAALLIGRMGEALVPADPAGKREPVPVAATRQYPLLCTTLIAATLPPYLGPFIFLLLGRAQVPWTKRVAGVAVGSAIPMAIVAFAGIDALPGPRENPPFLVFLVGGLGLGLLVEGVAFARQRRTREAS